MQPGLLFPPYFHLGFKKSHYEFESPGALLTLNCQITEGMHLGSSLCAAEFQVL